jgi:hypothetical protein
MMLHFLICMIVDLFQAPHNTVHFEIIGSTKALDFFVVDADTGDLKLKTSLLQDADASLQYTVRTYVFSFLRLDTAISSSG